MVNEYEKLLDEAYKNVKTVKGGEGRFEIPKVKGHFEGKKTIWDNFSQIASHLRRSPEHFQKFMLKELAISGQKEKDRLVLNRKFPSSKINEKVRQYAEEFVICKECGKPDTEIKKDHSNRITVMHCLACGAKHPVHSIK